MLGSTILQIQIVEFMFEKCLIKKRIFSQDLENYFLKIKC